MRKIHPISFLLILLMFLLVSLPAVEARFQDPAPVARAETARAANDAREQRYRIGVGDVLIIRVFGHPDLGGEVPVTSAGNIRLPFFDEIPAACRTEFDLAAAIAEKMRKYLRDPQVDVIVKEYRSQPVAVMGAVAQPGKFLLQRRVRLLELLANAGGPAANAGSTVFVIHNTDLRTCETTPTDKVVDENAEGGNATQAGLTTYKLRDLMTGSPEANRFVEPGDIISIPDADQVFLTGNILRPGPLPLKGQLTLLDAIAMAGGFQAEASKKNVRLIRHDGSTGSRKEIVYNAEDIEKRRAEDVLLQANDIVAVSSSAIKNLRKSLLQIVPATVSTLPIVILP